MIYRGTEETFRKLEGLTIPEKLPFYDTIPEFLRSMSAFGDAPAVGRVDGTAVSYADFFRDICGMCGYFARSGLPRRGNVGLYSENGYFFVVCSFAIMAYGCCAVHIPPSLGEAALAGAAIKYDLTALVCANAPTAEAAALPGVRILCPGEPEQYRSGADEDIFDETLTGETAACIFFTGGTTGASKGAVLSHKALLSGAGNAAYTLFSTEHVDAYIVLPLTHVFGYIRSFLFNMLRGSTVYFNTNKRNMFRDLSRLKPQEIVAVPRLADVLLTYIQEYGVSAVGGRLNTIISGAANVPSYLVRSFDAYGISLFPGYGMTETANLTCGNPIPLRKPNSVGPLYPEQEAKIVDGELWLRGRNLFTCYYADEKANEEAFEDGWFKTGDLAHFDADGFLYITGRIKSLIVFPSGEKISPDELESRVNELDIIQDALLFRTVSAENRPILRLEVTLRRTVADTLEKTADALEAYVIGKITEAIAGTPESLMPSEIAIRTEDFERTPALKIKRP